MLRGALAGTVVEKKPNVQWDDVAGLEGAKGALREAVILPVMFPQLFSGKRKPWNGILLYGPPGTGKSYLAKAVATECNSKFYCVSSSELVSKWKGESERLVRNLFEMAHENKPSVIFVNQIDSLCSNRSEGESDSTRRIKIEFLSQMQGVGNRQDGVPVLGATNCPWELDPVVRQRFEKRVYIALPVAAARAFMFKHNVGDTPNSLTEADYQQLGSSASVPMAGCSGSDISAVINDALMEPLRKCQTAKQFRPVTVQGDAGPKQMWEPCLRYPNCASCPTDLATAPCSHCGAVRQSFDDLEEPGSLKVPEVCVEDFESTMNHSLASIANEELEHFVQWTEEFGQDG